MRYFWKSFKRWGLPLVARVGVVMPVLIGVGVVLLLVAIWWLGPQWSWRQQQPLASVSQRAVASLLLVLVPMGFWLVTLRSRIRQLRAKHELQAATEADPCLPVVQAQEQALNRQLTNLFDNADSRRVIYQLPWYMVVGVEGAGKSSLIDGSEQRFALSRIGEVQGRGHQQAEHGAAVGWWISDEAVILDPPGELISHQEHTPGNGAATTPAGAMARRWEHLLDWLARTRSRKALNGVVLVIDIASLLHDTPTQRAELARVLRTRLHELSARLGTCLPLYVVLSKFDLLDGFDQMFSRLSASQREQLFGFTFALDSRGASDKWLAELDTGFDRLISIQDEYILDAMSKGYSVDQSQRLVSLQAQLVGMRSVLKHFFQEALTIDRFTAPAQVRGLYLSSVHQQGQMTNAFIREAAQPYTRKPPLSEGKPTGTAHVYFAQQLFQRVVYPEAGLCGDNANVAREKRRLRWLSVGVGMLAFAVAGATWHRYFALNQDKSSTVLSKSKALNQGQVDDRLDPTGRNLLDPLGQLRDAVSVFGDYRSAWPIVADFGLYSGWVIGPKLDEAYLNLLSQRFLPAIASGVVDAMTAAPEGSEQQMAALRVYRMIEDRQSRQTPWVESWMAQHWQSAFPGQGRVQEDLMRHLKYALAYADTDLPQFRERIAEVQQKLRSIPLSQRVYAALKQQALEQLETGLDLRREVGPAFDVVYRTRAEGNQYPDALSLAPLVTAQGFKTYFEPRSLEATQLAMIDQWALGERQLLAYSEADRDALTARIRNLYSADYINSWQHALSAFSVADFHDLRHAVSVLEQLTGPAAPLRRLLETVRDNTAFYQPVPEGHEQGLAGPIEPVSPAAGPSQASDIRRAFVQLNELLTAKGEHPSAYEETMTAMMAVHEYAKTVQDSPDQGKAALQAVLQRFSMTGQDPILTLQRVATGLPEPIRHQVRKVAEQTAQVLVVEALRELDRRWDADVYSFFQQRLAGRYPFVVRAPDASLDDFEAFFGPKGRLQQFQQQYLKVFLEDNREALYADGQGGQLIRPELIEQLAAADRIRETFFDPRGNLSVQFSIEPLGLSANQRTSVLDLDGQLISYTHGPRHIAGVIWPNTAGSQVRSNLTLLRLNGTSSSLEYRGPWSMFRLLSRGTLNGRTPTSVDLSFRTGEGMMRYQLSSEKAFNPITQQPFKGFDLPRTLLQQATPEAAQTSS
ncbi:type VI secretion system membrane subunit TssM [Pseudomonas sp. Teo4]|uniref:type VI secretion system membrane subunit TssM n=1 Tax=Pseudomonas sp. Teo4 TaxID=3064528 RepID=UPI002AB94FC6|nr:type VI secretion system membrane subunit TssM [Pseudomonas sp. Teo4]MDZ3992493.1 hypothetical protein [Pseudomonas sp. Teo4]